MPQPREGPARPPQEKLRRGPRPCPNRGKAQRGHPRKIEEGTEAIAQPGGGPARPPQEKRRRGRRPWPNRGKDQRGHPGKKGGGDRGQSPTRGGPGEATPGQMGGAVAEAIAQRGVRAGRGHPRKNGGGVRGQTPTRGRPGETTPGKNGGGNRGRPNERVGTQQGPQRRRRRGKTQKGLPRSRGPFWRRRGRPKWLHGPWA